MRQITHIALQGRPQSSEFVKTFYLKYGNNGLDFNSYGQNATVKYKVLAYYCTLEFYKCFFISVLISAGLLPKYLAVNLFTDLLFSLQSSFSRAQWCFGIERKENKASLCTGYLAIGDLK